MASLRYLTPFAFLALLPLGQLSGGGWTFLAAVATPLGLAALDAAFGNEAAAASRGFSKSRWVPRAYVVLQLAATAWAALHVASPSTGWIEAGGLTASAGVTTGVFGFVAAHELVHSREKRELALGLTFLASVFYMQFRIAHLYGHHRRAATFEDPASARLGEGLYAFIARSIGGQFREAWAFEARRSRRNRMIAYLAIEAMLLVALALASWRALLFVLAVAFIAVCLLEAFNYVAHYGLSRGAGERLEARHSWNSERRMNNASLLNMGRHSDHHRRASGSYETLTPVDRSARLPSGYAAALLTALVPPLWRRVMDPRVRAVMEGR
jgi:alkane 1-monooxygenase